VTSSLDETAGFASRPSASQSPSRTPAASPAPTASEGPRPTGSSLVGSTVRTKAVTLLAIALLALVLRVFLVLVVHPVCPSEDDRWRTGEIMTYESLQQRVTGTAAQQTGDCVVMVGDPLYTMGQARMIADGQGMSSPILYGLTGRLTPGAARPPAWTISIAVLNKLGLKTPTEARLLASLLGALGVAVMGYVAWQLAGRWAGTAAALFAAFNPNLFINDWHLLNDGPYSLVCALILLVAYRLWARPSVGRAVALGAMIGIGYYTRSEAVSFMALLVVPLAFWLKGLDLKKRAVLGGAAIATALALIGPFWMWNVSRFHHPHMTLGSGVVLLNASCDTTYFGDMIGMVGFECFDAASKVSYLRVALNEKSDESDIDEDYGAAARPYVSQNQRRLPFIAFIRVARVYDLYRPDQTIQWDVVDEQRGTVEPWLGLGYFYVLAPLAIAGLVHLRRRRIPLVPFAAFALSVTFTVATTFGLTRFRVPVDVSMCVLGGIGFAALRRWWLGVDADRRAGVLTGGKGAAAIRGVAGLARSSIAGMRGHHRRVLGGGAGGLVLVLVVLVWSAGAQPIPHESPTALYEIAGVTEAEALGTCLALGGEPALADFTHHLSSGQLTIAPQVVDAFARVEAKTTIPEIKDDIRVLREVAELARDGDLSVPTASNARGPEARARFEQAVERVLLFGGDHCQFKPNAVAAPAGAK
jgi:hypothetical protein